MDEKMDILGVQVAVTNLEEATMQIDHWIRERHRTYICVAPVSTVIEAQDDKHFRAIVNDAGMVTPDGMPLVWTGQLRGNKHISRTYGPDLMLALFEKGEKRGYRHFLYGGTQESNERLIENIKSRYPFVNIIGHWSPPIREKDEMEESDIIQMINNAAPDILWVGLGAPKQEYWMHNHRDKLEVPVMLGVGAAFDFLSGAKKQAPKWMQRSGLEWFFRLCCEPGRLWRRYIIGNTRFLFLSLRSWLRSKTGKSHEA